MLNTKAITPDLVEKIARNYLECASLEELAKLYNSSKNTVSTILKIGIAEDILPDWLANEVFDKAVFTGHSGEESRKRIWNECFILREKAKKEKTEEISLQKESLRSEIDELKFIIEVYDDYFFDEGGAPSKQELQSRLDYLEEILRRL